ncbi:MAG: NAD(P)-dependent oxidoreductase [Woeseiaceae bacterium]
MAKLGSVTRYDGGELKAFLAPLEVLFVRLAHRIDAALLEQALRLRFLCSPTTAHTHLDEAALARRGVRLLSLRGERSFLESIRATPEHTFGLILALLRRYKGAFAHVEAGGWDRDRFRGEELSGKRVGIIGLGRVGSQVACYCAAFGAEVCFCDPEGASANTGWQRLPDAISVIGASRIVVLCAAYTEGMAPIIGPAEVKALSGRYFINTARGELVDEPALLAAIAADRLTGAASDMMANETGAHQLSQWRSAAAGRNVILTPHLGGATVEAMARTEAFIADKLVQALASSGELV